MVSDRNKAILVTYLLIIFKYQRLRLKHNIDDPISTATPKCHSIARLLSSAPFHHANDTVMNGSIEPNSPNNPMPISYIDHEIIRGGSVIVS